MLLRLLALALLASSSAAAQRPERTAPHLRPLVWHPDSLAQQEIALDDSTFMVFDVPASMRRPSRFDDPRVRDCVGGHWTPSPLITVRLYERYQLEANDHSIWPLSLLTWDERPLFCLGALEVGRGDGDPLWVSYRDSLAVGAIRTAVERCPPDPDPDFRCTDPEITDRFTTAHGLEVVALTLRYVDGYDLEAPAPGAHTIGPYYALRLPSRRYPFLYVHPARILAWRPQEARYSDLEVAFVRRVLESAQVIEADAPLR